MLMSLPNNLRITILTLLVVFAEPLEVTPWLKIATFFALSLTSRSLRTETLGLFFSKNNFMIEHSPWAWQLVPGSRQPHLRFLDHIQYLEIRYDGKEYEGDDRWSSVTHRLKSLKRCTFRLGPTTDWHRVFSNARKVKDACRICPSMFYFDGSKFLMIVGSVRRADIVINVVDEDGKISKLDATAMAAIRKVHQAGGISNVRWK